MSLLAEPASFLALCADLASGMTLTEWCRKSEVNYALAYEWLHSEPARVKAYAVALEARTSSLTDRFVSGVRTVTDADPRRAYSKKGRALSTHELPDDVAMALDGLETTSNDRGEAVTKLRMVPKARALELLGRHLGAFRDKLDVDLKIGLADRMKAARLRALEHK